MLSDGGIFGGGLVVVKAILVDYVCRCSIWNQVRRISLTLIIEIGADDHDDQSWAITLEYTLLVVGTNTWNQIKVKKRKKEVIVSDVNKFTPKVKRAQLQMSFQLVHVSHSWFVCTRHSESKFSKWTCRLAPASLLRCDHGKCSMRVIDCGPIIIQLCNALEHFFMVIRTRECVERARERTMLTIHVRQDRQTALSQIN